MCRWTRSVAVLALLVAAMLPLWEAAAQSDSASDEDAFVRLVARERQAAGLPGYSRASDLDAVARRHAQRMASEGRMYHNQNLPNEVENWEVVAENVGRGPEVGSIHEAFMGSETHRREIMSTRFTDLGMGVAYGHDLIWVAQVFRKPVQAAPAAPTTTAAPSEPEPVPEVTPAAKPAPRPEAPAAPAVRPAAKPAPAAPAPAAPMAAPAPPAADEVPPSGEPADLVALGAALAGAGPENPPSGVPLALASATRPAGVREVSPPVAAAAGLLLLVVTGLAAEVLGEGAPARSRSRRLPRRAREPVPAPASA